MNSSWLPDDKILVETQKNKNKKHTKNLSVESPCAPPTIFTLPGAARDECHLSARTRPAQSIFFTRIVLGSDAAGWGLLSSRQGLHIIIP